MQTHVFEDPREPNGSSMADRRSHERQHAEFTMIRYVVVLGLSTVCRAEVIDDSGEGIGILIDDISSSTVPGDVIEVIYGGERRAGAIRHITEKAKGYHVGLHWHVPDDQK